MEQLIRTATAKLAERIEAATVAYQQTMQEAGQLYERLLMQAQHEYEQQLALAMKGEDEISKPTESPTSTMEVTIINL